MCACTRTCACAYHASPCHLSVIHSQGLSAYLSAVVKLDHSEIVEFLEMEPWKKTSARVPWWLPTRPPRFVLLLQHEGHRGTSLCERRLQQLLMMHVHLETLMLPAFASSIPEKLIEELSGVSTHTSAVVAVEAYVSRLIDAPGALGVENVSSKTRLRFTSKCP